MDREDVGVLEARREPDLAKEAPRPQGVRQLRMQHLHRDEPLVPDVVRQIDRRRTPAPDLAREDVASGDGVVEQRRNV
jgi:hypothetical protein